MTGVMTKGHYGLPIVNATNFEGAAMQTIDEARENCQAVGMEIE